MKAPAKYTLANIIAHVLFDSTYIFVYYLYFLCLLPFYISTNYNDSNI